MLHSLVVLALIAQSASVSLPVQEQVTEGWSCPARPTVVDSVQLAASGCRRTSLDELDPQGRELWFLADVAIDTTADFALAPLTVAIGAAAASSVYWNGTLIGNIGQPGTSRAMERPGLFDATLYLPAAHVRSGHNTLLLRMSGFHNRLHLTTPVHYIIVAEYGTIQSRITPYYLPSIMMTGALLVALAYFGGVWFFSKRDTPALLVMLMAASALGQLAAELWRGLFPLPYHWHAWRLLAIEVMAIGFALALVAYVAGRFTPRWRTRAVLVTLLVPMLTSRVPGYDLWTLLTLALPIVLALLLVLPAARRGDDGARAMAAAFVFFLALVVVDTSAFVDRGFYLGAAMLAMVLLHDQWRVGQTAHLRQIEATRRVEQLEAQLLRRRFAPHWLLNTLNALTDWVESDPPTAVRLIEALGEEFHLVAAMSGKALVPLRDELALCQTHLAVMSLRVDCAFHLECVDVDDELEVPPGIVQTLIENAFSHGRYATGAAFVLRQIPHATGVQLELITPPPQDGARATTSQHNGEGLEYVRAQLRQAFGDGGRLVDGPVASGGWRTELLLGASA
jgi:Histidine kinase